MIGFVSASQQAAIRRIALVALGLLLALMGSALHAHGVDDQDKAFIAGASGLHIIPYMYLGAKHMVTGYDHLLFLAGVIFFLYRMRDIGIYVSLFAIGHTVTLLAGVIFDIRANPYIIDAIIGLSVVYKALDNMNAFDTLLGWRPDPKVAVLVFGFFHGFGLATKLQDLTLGQDGLIANLVAFNVGVELGQFMALGIILIVVNVWRMSSGFQRHALAANAALMSAGFMLMGYQLAGYFIQGSST